MNSGLIVFLAIAVILLIAVLVLVIVIRNKVREFSRDIFGTSSLSQGFKKQQENLAETPRSVSSMTKIYLPQIKRDFPEFNLEEYTQKAENVLEDYLNAISEKKELTNPNCSEDLKLQAHNIINDLNKQGATQHYSQIVIHDTQISMYKKTGATVEITFQSAIGYISYLTKENGQLLSGDKSLKTQTVYDTCLVYIQDISKVEEHNHGEGSVGINCPNCGAPITNLGTKFCEYCGTGIKEINIYSWKFNRIEEKTKSKKYF